MSLYRKKPVVIEAWQFSGSPGFLSDDASAPEWLTERERVYGNARPGQIRLIGDASNLEIEIHTLEGVMRAQRGDWIIKGVKGEVYPCKPDIFAATYEPVEPSEKSP